MANSKRQRKNTASLLGALFRTCGKRKLLVTNEGSLGGKSSETKSLPAFFSPSLAPPPPGPSGGRLGTRKENSLKTYVSKRKGAYV